MKSRDLLRVAVSVLGWTSWLGCVAVNVGSKVLGWQSEIEWVRLPRGAFLRYPGDAMARSFFLMLVAALAYPAGAALASGEGEGIFGDGEWANLEAPEHDYWNRPLKDRFTALKESLEKGDLTLDRSGELPYLQSLF